MATKLYEAYITEPCAAHPEGLLVGTDGRSGVLKFSPPFALKSATVIQTEHTRVQIMDLEESVFLKRRTMDWLRRLRASLSG